MTADAKKFLDGWVETYISAEARSAEQAQKTADECLEDARSDGIDDDDLHAAAGGNLVGYLRQKIKETSGEDDA